VETTLGLRNTTDSQLSDDGQTSPYRIREGLPTTHYVTAKQVFNAISKPYSPTPEMVWAKDCDCRNQSGIPALLHVVDDADVFLKNLLPLGSERQMVATVLAALPSNGRRLRFRWMGVVRPARLSCACASISTSKREADITDNICRVGTGRARARNSS